MSFKKSVSVLLIVSQFAVASSMAALVAPLAPATTPEFNLLQNVLALQGQDLSSSARQQQVADVITAYMTTAPTQGQQERLERAFVDLGVYTPAQAQVYVGAAQSAAKNVNSSDALVNEVQKLAGLHPAGAQFGSCDGVDASAALPIIGGIVTLAVGSALRFYNPSCTTSDQLVHGRVVVVSSQCSVANDYPDATAGDYTMIGGGVLLAVGAFILVYEMSGC